MSEPRGEICLEVGEEDMEMLRKEAVDHLGVDVLTNQFHIAADVPKFLPDLEVLPSAFVVIDVQTNPLAFVVKDDVLIIAKGSFGFLVAPLSRLEGLHRLDLLELLCFDNVLPA